MFEYDLAVIIVNYNVKTFLHFCLKSLKSAHKNLNAQIIVVDNNSTDNSCEFIEKHHPDVHLIKNQSNHGYSKACNQGFKKANAEYVLFLNPDMIIPEGYFESCREIFNQEKDVGAVGIKMVDGYGQFLPESKRGLPSVRNTFFKQIGLYKLYPKSPLFNGYYMGNLSNSTQQKVEIITGAFFFTKTKILDEIGIFDEKYFMYGEDIDLSYRIREKGHSIYYNPDVSAIHFKGESTQKTSIKYLTSFYGSMMIFVNKHYRSGQRIGMKIFLFIGIILSGVLGFIKQLLKSLSAPIIDSFLIFYTIQFVAKFWGNYYHLNPNHFDAKALMLNVCLFTIIWISSLAIHGQYLNSTAKTIWKGLWRGFLVILIVYALLGTSLRSSRAVIFISFALVVPIMLLKIYLLNKVLGKTKRKEILIEAGQPDLEAILKKVDLVPSKNPESPSKVYEINNSSFHSIINNVIESSNKQEPFFWDNEQKILINSKDKTQRGHSIDVDILYDINLPESKILKRAFDIGAAVLFFLLYPILLLFIHHKISFGKNIYRLFTGKRALIAYPHQENLPLQKKGFWFHDKKLSKEEQNLRMKDYALHYHIWKDISIFLGHFKGILHSLDSEDD